jgi:hypothetical protein
MRLGGTGYQLARTVGPGKVANSAILDPLSSLGVEGRTKTPTAKNVLACISHRRLKK